MADRRDLHLISYDIRDPKRWRRAYRVLRGYGQRVQYSLFRVYGTAAQIASLRWRLEGILDRQDALLVLRVCPACADRICATHDDDQWPGDIGPYKVLG